MEPQKTGVWVATIDDPTDPNLANAILGLRFGYENAIEVANTYQNRAYGPEVLKWTTEADRTLAWSATNSAGTTYTVALYDVE